MTIPDTKAIRENMKALGVGTTGQRYVNEPKKMELIGRIHRVLNPENCSAEFVLAWDRPEAGEVDETDEDIANARLIGADPDMRETILALCDALDDLRADNERLRRALTPFVLYVHDDYRRGEGRYVLASVAVIGGKGDGWLEAEDFRLARAALAQKEGSYAR